MASQVNSGTTYSGSYFKQTANIDLSAHYWVPIGTSSSNSFQGTYDGDGHTISNMTTSEVQRSGLFGEVNSATIQNLGIENSIITADTSTYAAAAAGGIVGWAISSTIINCYNTGTVTASSSSSSTDYAGGIVGTARSSTTIINCYNTGSVTATGSSVSAGGIVGIARSSTISNSYNTGSVTSTSSSYTDCTGGIVGYVNSSTISNSYNTGSVTASYTGSSTYYRAIAGGIVGYASSSTISNSYNTGSVSATALSVSAGGIVGTTLSLTISNCYYGGNCTLSYGIGSSSGNTGCTKLSNLITQAKTQSWYTSSLNWNSTYPWDCVDTWAIVSSLNDGYPVFAWQLNQLEYTLNFDANGGTLNIGAQIKVTYGSTYTMPSTSNVTRTGYTLTGWRAVVNNSTYTYNPGEVITIPTWTMTQTTVTFYAQWRANTYTVKFNDQGGTTNFADMVLIDSTYKTNGTYTFTRNGVTVTYDVSDSALTLNGKPTNDINLFINLGLSFTQNDVYKVSYQKISGSMSGNTTGCFVLEVCDASWALLETRNRVDFHMNNSSGSANLTISSSGATQGSGLKLWFWCNENATPSRVFNNFKVKFKIEKSGTQNVQKQTRFTYGSALEAVAPPTRVGYNFQGYYTQTGGRGTRYFDASGHPVVSTMNIANNITTLHAYWTIKTDCTIYYDSSAAGNFDNWTKYTYGDRIDSSYDESSQTNTINITGGGGWETMAIPIYFPTTGVRYTITFNYSGTFKYLSGYNGLRMQLLTSQPAAGNNQNIQAAYANLTSHSAGTTASATISITPSQNIYYLTLNLGYLKDDDPYTLTFNNFNFTSTSGEAARVYQSGHTFNQAVTNLLVPADRGSIFTGWVTESGKAFNSGSTMNAEEIYLNAQWADTWGNHYSSALTQDTSDDYWMISSSKDLARLIYLFNYTTRIDVLKMKFKLTNHIDMSDHYWLPLGTEDRVFSALIDGRGYTIKGLKTISQSLRKDNGGDNSGFIGVSGSYTEKSSTGVTTTYKATIKNIYFEDISINGRNYVAGVVGSVLGDTTISAIAVVGEIYGTNTRGGIAAYAPSTSLATISDCLVDVSPSNIVIRNNYITATNSVNYSTGKLAKTSGTFTNWIENLTGMKYTMLPKGLTWIAEGK